MGIEVPFRCEGSCPLEILDDEAHPVAVGKNCPGPEMVHAGEVSAFDVTLNLDGTIYEVKAEEKVTVSKLACRNLVLLRSLNLEGPE